MRAAEQVFVGIPGPELDSATRSLLAAHQPGGLVLFGRNIKDPEQLNDLVTDIRRVLPEAVLSIDAEGGAVDRLRNVVGAAPSAAVLGRNPASFALQAGTWIAQSLRLFDIDVDFAPVVDLNRGESDNGLEGRCFGVTPGDVIPRARAFLRGLHAGGAGGCLKHFPGLGGAPADTHHKAASVYLTEEALRADLDPFDALGRLAGSVMVGHAIYPAYDAVQRPASLSPIVIGGLLRGRLGFQGLVFSDDLEMKVLDEWGSLAERSEAAFAAGCDVLLLCHTLEAFPEVVARLENPVYEERLQEANRRLDIYRQRLRTLRSARDYIRMMKEASRGERLEHIRSAMETMQASAR
jgi:beta-N-acetylhexosaminidase